MIMSIAITTIEDLPWMIQEKIRLYRESLVEMEAVNWQDVSPLEYLMVDNQHSTYTALLLRSIEWEIYSLQLLQPFMEEIASRFRAPLEELQELRAKVIHEDSDSDGFFAEVENRVPTDASCDQSARRARTDPPGHLLLYPRLER